MASWFGSLDNIEPLHTLVSWIAIAAAVVAAACGIFAYILSNQASALREQAASHIEPSLQEAQEDRAESEQQVLEAEKMQAQLKQEVESLQASLEESRQKVRDLEEEASTARQERDAQRRRADQAQQQASQRQSELAGARADLDELRAAQAAQKQPFSEQKRNKLLHALSGKPAGEVTVVAVDGNESSQSLAQGLDETLQKAGWKVVLRQGRFATEPEGLYFVVHSQESMPQYTLQLAVGLAVIDLMPIPAKIRVNPEKPPGSLGIVVGNIKP